MRHARTAAALAASMAAAALAWAGPAPRTLAEGPRSAVEKQRRSVIRTQAAWAGLWKLHAAGREPEPALPRVDWSREMVLAAFMGTRSTGGYRVRITGAEEKGGRLVVQVSETAPPADAIVIQALTSPFHLAAVPRSDLPVTWRVTEEKK